MDVADVSDNLTPIEAAEVARVSRPTILRLHAQEGLPGIVVSRGPRGRKILRFSRKDLLEWLAARREVQIRRTLEGDRYQRREVRR